MKHSPTATKSTLPRLVFLATALLALPGADECNPNGGQQAEPARTPELKIASISTDHARARRGDPVVIDWELQDPQLLKHTRVTFLSPILQGYDSQYIEWDTEATNIGFEFQGPVTIHLQVQDATGKGDSIMFDIKWEDAYELEVDVSSSHPGYPRLQYPQGAKRKHLSFSNFAAFYDPSDAVNGMIDGLALDPVLSRALPVTNDFLAVSWNGNESSNPLVPGFGLAQGSGYPTLTAGFLATDIGGQFAGTRKADAIVFGGAISYTGVPFPVDVSKLGGETIQGFKLVERYEAIFIELVYVSDAAGRMYLADALLGNLNQGLVVSIFRAEDILLVTGCYDSKETCPQVSATYSDAAGGTYEINGELEAQLGWPVTTTAGDFLHPTVRLEKLTYQMPFYADNDPGLMGRLPTGIDGIVAWQ